MDSKNEIALPKHIVYIIKRLSDFGFASYCVGGAVRDRLLGQKATDWDITTDATPDDVERIFEKTVGTGKRYGTVTILIQNNKAEVTTMRRESGYFDYRHPDMVSFGKSLYEDLKRRDFTVNALAYNPNEGIIDYFNGIGDINNRIIRAVGNPGERFSEDALRVLRALRFSSSLDFDIEGETLDALFSYAEFVNNVSRERVKKEIELILKGKRPEYIYDIVRAKALPDIFKRTDGFEKVNLRRTGNKDGLRLILFLYTYFKHSEKEIADALRALKYDNKTVKRIGAIVGFLNSIGEVSQFHVRKAIFDFGPDAVRDGVLLTKDLGFEKHSELKEAFEAVLSGPGVYGFKNLAVDSEQLIGMGLKGPEIKKAQLFMLEIVLKNPELNTKEHLTKALVENKMKL